MIKQIGLPLRGLLILLMTRMITDQIGLHSVLLPLLISINSKLDMYSFRYTYMYHCIVFVVMYSFFVGIKGNQVVSLFH